jgi:hypothetical protein
MASSVNHTVRLPRCRSASLYSDQFVTRRFGRAMWWRRSALYLCGMTARSGASKQAHPYAIPHIRATRCRVTRSSKRSVNSATGPAAGLPIVPNVPLTLSHTP